MVPGTEIHISWELDNYQVMNMQGELQKSELSNEGTMVKLQAILSYGEERLLHEFFVVVYPLKIDSVEEQLRALQEVLYQTEAETRQQEWFPLPNELAGQPIRWNYPRDKGIWGLALLGAIGAGLIYVAEKQKKQEEKKKREQQMFLDYPQLIGKFTLFLGAGMTPRTAWFKMAEEYINQRFRVDIRFAYEEMIRTMYEIQSGISEGECYEKFGRRCNISQYRKFGALLSQNLRKGTKGITNILKKEADNAFEERKNMAKKLGEEAGTKLLLPMFLMLGIVLIIIVVPAFLTIQV